MFEDHRIEKVEILISQKKYPEAEQLLMLLLATDVYNVRYLSLLAEVCLQQDKNKEAEEFIDQALAQAPDHAYLFFIKARIALQQEDLGKAELIIQQAIQLEPLDADYLAMMGHIKLHRKNYEEALRYADEALKVDAVNLFALNTRSTALVKLNRKSDSYQTIEGALREDPNNSYTHANYGWGLLEKGNHKKALEHFKTALQHNPTNQHAQAGLLEAIKANNLIYKLYLKYAFFIGNLTSKNQWAVIIGFYLLSRLLRFLANSSPVLEPFLTPVIILLGIVAFSTWIIRPLGNMILRFNTYGQMLLSSKEKLSATLVGASFLVFIISLLLWLGLRDERFLSTTVYGVAMMLPFGCFLESESKRWILISATLGLAAIGLLAVFQTFASGQLFNAFTNYFLIGMIAFQWGANFILIREQNY